MQRVHGGASFLRDHGQNIPSVPTYVHFHAVARPSYLCNAEM